MKKIFIVLGMVLFIYSTMSIFSGEMNPLLWIRGDDERVFVLSFAFTIELLLFVTACIGTFGDIEL